MGGWTFAFFQPPKEPDRSPVTDRDPGDEAMQLGAEEQKIYDYRLGTLLKAGLDFPTADLIASGKDDLWRVVKAIKAGCPPETLVKVFV